MRERDEKLRFCQFIKHPQQVLCGLPVNKKWQFQTNKNKTLQRMMRDGLLKMKRFGVTSMSVIIGGKRSGSKQTYLVLTPAGEEWYDKNKKYVKNELDNLSVFW